MHTPNLARCTLFLLLGFLLLGAPPTRGQSLLAAYVGDSTGERMHVAAGGHDLDGDGAHDLLLGSPGDDGGGADAGLVQARSGATGAVIWTKVGAPGSALGSSMTLVPDMDGDGVRDVLVGAPGTQFPATSGSVTVLSGSSGAVVLIRSHSAAGTGFGTAVAGGFDWDHDGVADIAGGAPYVNDGLVQIWSGATGLFLANRWGSGAGALAGAAMAGIGDFDGDGFGDLAYGEPGAGGGNGRVTLDFGTGLFTYIGLPSYRVGASVCPAGDVDGDGRADLLAGAPGVDSSGTDAGAVILLGAGFPGTIVSSGAGSFDELGSSVANLGDVNGDGFDDWAAGATENGFVLSPGLGYVRVLSGKFQTLLYERTGMTPGQNFGLRVAGVGDHNGDGVPDLAVGAPGYDSPDHTRAGQVQVFSGGGPGFVSYCTAGTSTSGCQALVSGSGTPSAVLALPFTLAATGVEGDKRGLFFYGWNGRQASAWGNGTSFNCVVPPVKRTPLQDKSGTPGACDGLATLDLNTYWQANPNKNPGAGAVVQTHYWFRDPGSGSNQPTTLSKALEFVVGP